MEEVEGAGADIGETVRRLAQGDRLQASNALARRIASATRPRLGECA